MRRMFVDADELAEWLAGYSVPPWYAFEHVVEGNRMVDNPEVDIATANQMADAWKYHIGQLIGCGLLSSMEGETECEESLQ